MTNEIPRLCHDPSTRLRLSRVWLAAGVTMLARTGSETPDCIVIDLGRHDALDEVARLRALNPDRDIPTCAANFGGRAVAAARAAGATDFAARGHFVQRVARRFELAG